jgi:hypothetical protein
LRKTGIRSRGFRSRETPKDGGFAALSRCTAQPRRSREIHGDDSFAAFAHLHADAGAAARARTIDP